MSPRGQAAALAVAAILLAGGAALTWGRGGATSPPPAASASPGPALDGRSLFLAKGCAGCHAAAGVPSLSGWGPDLGRIAERAGATVPGLDAATYVRRSILEPGAYAPPGAPAAMPRLEVTPAEADAIADFLISSGR
ncbi:MAG: c-type cytochrome [Thermoleophilia bacterium]